MLIVHLFLQEVSQYPAGFCWFLLAGCPAHTGHKLVQLRVSPNPGSLQSAFHSQTAATCLPSSILFALTVRMIDSDAGNKVAATSLKVAHVHAAIGN
ncbi:hypothetical protein E2C01_029699 [Portunus trituberculatus]|uniref:Uncharacterized protein n=1 Tax=Portunus trituberculatus TaxID=210409 RepID=A0A5B7ESN1_PORTR|nr:hypothetical protein [Portunus trituberculatus]